MSGRAVDPFVTDRMVDALRELQCVPTFDGDRAAAVTLGTCALLRPLRSKAAVEIMHAFALALDLHRKQASATVDLRHGGAANRDAA